MNAKKIIDQLAALGIELVAQDEELRVRGRRSALTPELVETLRANKPALMAQLRQPAPSRDGAGIPGFFEAGADRIVQLPDGEIAAIVAGVDGGADNVQDIYPLTPLQEGMLFHHMMSAEADPYLLSEAYAFDSRERLDAYVAAYQAVIDRHDILRTAVVWRGLSKPMQVVWRRATLPVREIGLDDGDDALRALRRHMDTAAGRLDLTHAPLARIDIAHDAASGRWIALALMHHVVADHSTLEAIQDEILAHLHGRAGALAPSIPFRHFVASLQAGQPLAAQEAFFKRMLADVTQPTAPFGLAEAQSDGRDVAHAQLRVAPDLSRKLRDTARRIGVGPAALCHAAWAQVLARVTGQRAVVFGTVVFGRMRGGEGTNRTLGPFINTLPVRLDIDGRPVRELALQAQGLLAELLQHEHASLVVAQRCSGVAAPTPLFTSLLNYRYSLGAGDAAAAGERAAAWAGITPLQGRERTNYPLLVSIDDLGDDFLCTVHAAPPADPQRVGDLVCEALARLVEALDRTPARAAEDIDVLPAAERRVLVEDWNATERHYPQAHRLLHELVDDQAARTPDAVALSDEAGALTYAQLTSLANALAAQLVAHGVRPGDRVALCNERCLGMVVGALAVLKAGAAYLPLDRTAPAEQLRLLLEDGRPSAMLAGAATREAWLPMLDLAGPRVALLALPSHRDVPHAPVDAPRVEGLDGASLAYVIFTSGSTGRPKGVMNEHRGIVNRLLWMQDAYGLDGTDVVLQKTPLGFDVSVWELFWPLISGAELVVARPEGHRDPGYLAQLVQSRGVTTMHFVPSMLATFLEHEAAPRCSGLRRVVCSGEALAAGVVRRFQQVLPEVELHNLYGPTEAAVDVTAWTCPRPLRSQTVPIGRPIANTRLYVLDALGRPAPLGVAGELCIGGVQVARGYLNRPELTAERFVRDPFAADDGARMYRTGDLACWRADGTLEYLGRNDFQVKIRGLRIELGEVEARLGLHAAVRDAVVVALDNGGDKRLVAYVTARDGASIDVAALREHMLAQLPEYMVPAAYVALEAMPVSANGKLDRRALPEPDDAALVRRGDEAPQGEVEETLAAIWRTLLGLERIGRHDNFFELGGHSLMAIKMLDRLRRGGWEVDVRALFDSPTLAATAHAAHPASAALEIPENLIRGSVEFEPGRIELTL